MLKRTTSAETAARYHQARALDKLVAPRAERGYAGRGNQTAPAYVNDGVEIPRRKRRILLDLAPATVETLLKAIRLEGHFGEVPMGRANAERVLVEALENAR